MKSILSITAGIALLGALAFPASAACTVGCGIAPDTAGTVDTAPTGSAEAATLSSDGTISLDEGKLVDTGVPGAPGPETGPRNKPAAKTSGDEDSVAAE